MRSSRRSRPKARRLGLTQIVLDWRVAGPEFKGDAISGKETYRNYHKFLARQLVENDGDWTHLRAAD